MNKLIQLRSMVVAATLLVLAVAPADARRLRKTFDTDSATSFNTPGSSKIRFVTPASPDGVAARLIVRNQCAPYLEGAGYVPYVGLIRSDPPGRDPDFEEEFSDALPCAAEQPWSFVDGATVEFVDISGFGGEPGGYCALRLPAPSVGSIVLCGNGSLDGDEQCDDGNRDNGDGCSEYCIREDYLPTATVEIALEPETAYELEV